MTRKRIDHPAAGSALANPTVRWRTTEGVIFWIGCSFLGIKIGEWSLFEIILTFLWRGRKILEQVLGVHTLLGGDANIRNGVRWWK